MAKLEDLREAIAVGSGVAGISTGGAGPLVPKMINPILLEYVRKFAPLHTAFPRITWQTDQYFFNQRNQLPAPQFVQEVPPLNGTGSVAPSVSRYVQQSFPIKHFQVNGDVSKFAQRVATVNGPLLDLEIKGAAQQMAYLEEIGHIFGSAAATNNTYRPQWDGLDRLVGAANKIDATTLATNGVLSLPMLDALIDAIRVPYAANLADENFFYVMSPRMQSKLVQLTTSTTRLMLEKQSFRPKTDGGVMGNPVTIDMTDPGVEVYSYRNIPIVLSSFLSAQPQMSAVSLSQAAGTTPFASGATRRYVVSAVTLYGETLCSAEQSITVGAAGNSVTLTWTTPSILDPFGNATPILSYRIFTSAAAGAETLLAIVPAFDANDNPVTSFIDLGAPSTAASVFYQVGANGDGATYPLQPVAGNAGTFGMESIYLVSRDPELCVVPTVNPISIEILAPVNARSVQFALIGDETLALRAPLFASKAERVRFA